MEQKVKRIILASGSPRRREMLADFGISFEVLIPDADESCDDTSPDSLVRSLSLRKWQAARDRILADGGELDGVVMIAADTVVSCEGHILGKPRDIAQARQMLTLLSGRYHSVFSGVTVSLGDQVLTASEETRVLFDPLSDAALEHYLATRTVLDKAGAYAIQDGAAAFISRIEGDYFNVVGLPFNRLCHMLEQLGVCVSALCASKEGANL